jgi:PAS domain S-box-containing protein
MSELDSPAVFRTILESLQTGIYLVDHDQKILFWNDGAERITGYLRQDVVGRYCVDTVMANRDGQDSFASDAAEAIVTVLRDGKPVAVNVSLRHKDGHRVLVRLRKACRFQVGIEDKESFRILGASTRRREF